MGLSMHGTLGLLLLSGYLAAQEVEMMPLEKLPPQVNTVDYDEGSPVLSMDGKTLYFTRSGSPDFERTLLQDGMDISTTVAESDYRNMLSSIYSEISEQQITEPYTSAFNQDIWIAQLDNDTIAHVHHPGFPINNALPNSVLSTRLDSNKLVVINQFYKDGSMYEGFSSVQKAPGRVFTFPEPLHIYNFYNISSDVNLALSSWGQVMILSLERVDSYGSKDLYISFKIESDLWSEPQNLGSVLNSMDVECTPFISQDNRRLYFASNRPGTMGGLDIYVSERLDYTWLKWTAPKRIKEPINSIWDDCQPFHDEKNNNFYFSSRRDGSSDLFRLPLRPKPKLKAPIRIKGLIVDGVTMRPIRAELLYGPTELKNYLEYIHTFSGEFNFELTEYGGYKFRAHKPGYKDARLMFDTGLAEKSGETEHQIVLYMYRDSMSPVKDPLPVVVDSGVAPERPETTAIIKEVIEEPSFLRTPPKTGDKITFYNIYFEQSKPAILPTSKKALEDLHKMLTLYPDINIRIEGHTDNVGDETDLMELSWQRAQAVKEHLVQQGIYPSRIGTIGFGDTRPVSDNFSEEGRKANRRVEIQVVD